MLCHEFPAERLMWEVLFMRCHLRPSCDHRPWRPDSLYDHNTHPALDKQDRKSVQRVYSTLQVSLETGSWNV